MKCKNGNVHRDLNPFRAVDAFNRIQFVTWLQITYYGLLYHVTQSIKYEAV